MFDEEKDWLSQELKYENRISAWDLDEPNKVKKLHEDNCPREKLKNEHERVHEGVQSEKTIQSRVVKTNILANNKQSAQAKSLVGFAATVIVIMFLMMLLNVMFG